MSGGTPTFNDQTTFGLWTSLDYIWKNKKFEEMFEEFMPKEERINEIDNPAPTDKDFSLPSADPEVDRRYLGEASGEFDQACCTFSCELSFCRMASCAHGRRDQRGEYWPPR